MAVYANINDKAVLAILLCTQKIRVKSKQTLVSSRDPVGQCKCHCSGVYPVLSLQQCKVSANGKVCIHTVSSVVCFQASCNSAFPWHCVHWPYSTALVSVLALLVGHWIWSYFVSCPVLSDILSCNVWLDVHW